MDHDFDFFDLDFISDEDEKRYDSLSEEDQNKFHKVLTKKTQDIIDDMTAGLLDPDNMNVKDLDELFRSLIEETFKEIEPNKNDPGDWRGLPLLW